MRQTLLLLLFCTGIFSLQLTAQTIGFSINKRSGCVPLSAVTFQDVSSGGGGVLSRDWDLGNGEVIPNGAATVGTNYLTAQRFYIRLTVRFANNTTLTRLDSIDVHPKPLASFYAVDTAVCVGNPVNFISTSTTATGNLTNWQWDYGSGAASGNLPSPSYTYNTAGNYQVSLIVRNSWGCESNAATIPNYIHAYSRPVASFTASPNFSCKDTLTVRFNNTSTGGGTTVKYLWDFGDGDTSHAKSPVHFYANPGIYVVRLTARVGGACNSTVVTQYYNHIYVGKPTPQFITAPDTVCLNTPTVFNGRNIHELPPGGGYAYSYWYFTDNNQTQYYGNVTHTFTTPGNFTVMLIGYNYFGCRDTLRKTVHVKSFQPDFEANKLRGCAVPFTVNFTNTTTGNNLRFIWNFGDGVIRTVNGPLPITHNYTYFSNFTVTLTAIDTTIVGGCNTVRTKTSYIQLQRPNVDFTYVPPAGCKPLPVRFTAQVTNLIVPLTHYIWNFGDGNTITTTNTVYTHVYNNAGIFPVTLTIVTPECTYTSIVKQVIVTPVCDDDGGSGGGGAGGGGLFATGRTCTNKYTITFTDTIKNNTVVTGWRFGDGNPIYTGPTLNPVTHTFTPPQKVYIVTVFRLDTVTNIIDSAKKRVIIIDEKANFFPSSTNICINRNINFRTIGIDSSKINTYVWDFGNGRPRVTINNLSYYNAYGVYLNGQTSHVYADTGVFKPKLIITDKNGCRDSVEYEFITVRGPIAKFGAHPLRSCKRNELVLFTDSSVQNGNVPIVQWSWTFGDGSPVYNSTTDTGAAHVYANNSYINFYTVSLRVVDAIGCEATLTKSSYIRHYVPRADFYSYDTLRCNNYSIAVYNSSSFYNGTSLWSFGDGTTSTGYHGYKTYPVKDTMYSIKLVVTDENGCKDSISKPAFIKFIKPIADFVISDTNNCAPVTVRFRDSSAYSRSWVWNFGDGGTGSTDQNPSGKIYGTPGFYNLKLKITGPNSCVDSTVKTIRIKGPVGTLIPSVNSGCKPFNLNMRVTGSNIQSYAWSFADGTPVIPSVADSIINHPYLNAGRFLPNVVLTSPEGCPFTLKAVDTVYVDSLKPAFTQNKFEICGRGPLEFNGSAAHPPFSNVQKYIWDFGDGVIDSSANPITHFYNSIGTYNVKLTVRSKYGCVKDEINPAAVIVRDTPVVSFDKPAVITSCDTNLVRFTIKVISSTNIYQHYSWEKRASSAAHWLATGISGTGIPLFNGAQYEYEAAYPSFLAVLSDSGSQYRLRVSINAGGLSDDCAPMNESIVTLSVSDCVALPVRWLSVVASKKTGGNLIQWKTGASTAHRIYVVERSTDNRFFTPVYQVPSLQAAFATESYMYNDVTAPQADLYYRIKAVITATGTVDYSQTLLLKHTGETLNKVRLLQNPIGAKTALLEYTAGSACKSAVGLYDAKGKTIMRQTNTVAIGKTVFSLQLPAALAQGMYYLHVTFNGTTTVLKMIVE